ncbi:hypothetical protein, partial [Gemmiger formicilis]|uniref:hypothetical protein n=1 Tax=Gemmiger formicilis TaxID=745368 RepID=UPI003FD7BE44
ISGFPFKTRSAYPIGSLYHPLVKVAEMAGLAGIVGFHESEDGYIVSFPDTENTQALIKDYKARLRDLENNIWQH